jgi:hypothetical protein
LSPLKKAGNVVGYMGDGINDASALHAADVGISVEGAVDVAKEVADIVLLERDLEVLATLAVVAATFVLPYSPLSGILGLAPMPGSFLGALGAILALYIVAAELTKRAFWS